MNENGQAIFRAEAVRRHAESRDRTVLPRFVSPPTFVALWLTVALVAAAGVAAGFARAPIYAAGPVVVAEQQAPPFVGKALGMAFLPAPYRDKLRLDQTVFVDLADVRVARPVMAVEREVLSPAAARGRSGLSPAAANAITEPVVVVLLALEPLPSGLSASAYAGSVFDARVQVGSRRLLSLVPLIGPRLGG